MAFSAVLIDLIAQVGDWERMIYAGSYLYTDKWISKLILCKLVTLELMTGMCGLQVGHTLMNNFFMTKIVISFHDLKTQQILVILPQHNYLPKNGIDNNT